MEGLPGNSSFREALAAHACSDFHRVETILVRLPTEVLVTNLELPLLLASAKTQLFKHTEAQVILDKVKEAYLSARDEAFLTRWQNGYAATLLFEGRLDDASVLLEECASGAERHNDMRLVGYVNNTQGILFAHKGDIDRSVAYFSRSIAAWREIGNRKRVGFGHFNLAVLLREWGDAAAAAASYLVFREYVGGTETPHEDVLTSAERAMILLAAGDVRLACSIAEATVDKANAIGATFLRGLTGRVLGAVLVSCGRYEEAQGVLLQAHALSETSRNKMLLAEVTEELAILALKRDKNQEAVEYRNAAVRMYTSMKVIRHVERFTHRYCESSPT